MSVRMKARNSNYACLSQHVRWENWSRDGLEANGKTSNRTVTLLINTKGNGNIKQAPVDTALQMGGGGVLVISTDRLTVRGNGVLI